MILILSLLVALSLAADSCPSEVRPLLLSQECVDLSFGSTDERGAD